jgi:hypothetical protein
MSCGGVRACLEGSKNTALAAYQKVLAEVLGRHLLGFYQGACYVPREAAKAKVEAIIELRHSGLQSWRKGYGWPARRRWLG